MNKNIKLVLCITGGIIGMTLYGYTNKEGPVLGYALGALIGAWVTNWIISLQDS